MVEEASAEDVEGVEIVHFADSHRSRKLQSKLAVLALPVLQAAARQAQLGRALVRKLTRQSPFTCKP